MLCGLTLNNSGIIVKECAGHSGLKSHSANISWGMRFEECLPRLWMVVGSERVSIHGRGLFSCTRQPSERKRRETSANRERTNKLNPHMTPGRGIEPGPHWWEASAHTTTPALPSLVVGREFKKRQPTAHQR